MSDEKDCYQNPRSALHHVLHLRAGRACERRRLQLCFALAEDEVDDGRMHHLEVGVKAPDQKGKNRKLQVSSRQGYYMSTTVPKETAAKAQ